jgi:integrase
MREVERVTITKALVLHAEAPAKGQVFIRDTAVKGFALRVTDRGVKSFIWEGRFKGRRERYTIGQFPDWSVQNAREKALAIKAGVAHGIDPFIERKASREELVFGHWKEEDGTGAGLVQAYMNRHAKPHKRSWKGDQRLIDSYVPASWDGRRLSDIGRDDVAKLHDKIGREHGHYAANQLIRLLRTMFNLAINWELFAGNNPAARHTMFPEQKRDRFLSADELARVNNALMKEPNPYWRAYFALCLYLGTRKSELLSAHWSGIDFKQKTWRIEQTKVGHPHVLPLPAAAISILESLPSRGKSEWVFPGVGATGHLVEAKIAWKRIRDDAKVPDVRIHDLRRTLGSWLAASGHSLQLIGKALNHTNPNTTAIYARLQLDSVRDALESNSQAMIGGPVAVKKRKRVRA